MAQITQAKMRAIVAQISAADKKFAPLIARRPLCTIGRSASQQTHFQALVSSIISQQLATKAAETIHGRLNVLCKNNITPKKIAAFDDLSLREIGVSGAKARTITGLALADLAKKIPVNYLHEIQDDQEIAKALTSLWGIGQWTVDMFMIFQLGRLDIWPTGDLAVRRGWDMVYKNQEETSAKVLSLKGEKFRPYRSVVAWYCYQVVHESRNLDF